VPVPVLLLPHAVSIVAAASSAAPPAIVSDLIPFILTPDARAGRFATRRPGLWQSPPGSESHEIGDEIADDRRRCRAAGGPRTMLTACGSSSTGTGTGGSSGSSSTSSTGTTTSSAGSTMTIAMVTHASPGDSFWTVVQNGAEAAAAQLGVKLSYQASGGDVQNRFR